VEIISAWLSWQARRNELSFFLFQVNFNPLIATCEVTVRSKSVHVSAVSSACVTPEKILCKTILV
jgi:hypothetical protein